MSKRLWPATTTLFRSGTKSRSKSRMLIQVIDKSTFRLFNSFVQSKKRSCLKSIKELNRLPI